MRKVIPWSHLLMSKSIILRNMFPRFPSPKILADALQDLVSWRSSIWWWWYSWSCRRTIHMSSMPKNNNDHFKSDSQHQNHERGTRSLEPKPKTSPNRVRRHLQSLSTLSMLFSSSQRSLLRFSPTSSSTHYLAISPFTVYNILLSTALSRCTKFSS